MKKKLLLILLMFAVLLCGCKGQREQGDIQDAVETEAYYVETDYYSQPFIVINDMAVDEGRQVTFATSEDADCSDGLYSLKLEPNTYFIKTFTQDEYDRTVNGFQVFEWSAKAFTFVFPDGKYAKYCTVIADDVDTAFIAAKKEKGEKLPFDEEYLRKWKFIWIKR